MFELTVLVIFGIPLIIKLALWVLRLFIWIVRLFCAKFYLVSYFTVFSQTRWTNLSGMCLSCDSIAIFLQKFCKFLPTQISWKFHNARTSCFTMWSLMILGLSSSSKWHSTASLIIYLSSSRVSASVKME